ncbi:MAG TPA: STAS domain-containing protein [Gammaproteobacteria bacterium]|nr:STAS domain-containing protein [Gammaproteobacteria bacterium]
MVNEQDTEAAATICLPAEANISICSEYLQRFHTAFEAGGDIRLDAGAVDRIDAAFLQLLYNVQRALADTGRHLEWTAQSTAVDRAARLLGMRDRLGHQPEAGATGNV